MSLSISDLAKYPFLPEAAQKVKSWDLEIDSFENPGLKKILDRAENRIIQSMENNPPEVEYIAKNEDVEIPSFPVAVMLIAAMNIDYVKKRYALAESIRVQKLLRNETNKNKIIRISKCFNWKIRLLEREAGLRHFDYGLHFTDFLKNSTYFHEKEWKLVNKIMSKGEVLLTKKEVARLLQEEVRVYIEKKASLFFKHKSKTILDKVAYLKGKFSSFVEKAHFEEYPKEIMKEAFPPCINNLYMFARSGSHVSHIGRFTLTSFLLNIGMELGDILDLFRQSSDFNERMARYQIEHIAGERGSRIKYTPPTCETLRTHGLCPEEEMCKSTRHPLRYYLNKTRMLKKEESSS